MELNLYAKEGFMHMNICNYILLLLLFSEKIKKPVAAPKKKSAIVAKKNLSFQNSEPLATPIPIAKKYCSTVPDDSGIQVRKLTKKVTNTGKTVNSPVVHYCLYCNDNHPHQKIVRHWELKVG